MSVTPFRPAGRMLMKYRELSYYGFGLATACCALRRSGFAAGARETGSALLQPVNSYTRFPEYYFMEEAIKTLQADPGQPLPDVLDVGSPKLFGLWLACHYRVRVWLTDISPLNIEPYVPAWRTLESRARGEARFDLQDVRRLSYPDAAFDAVYAMSVLEHVEGERADAEGALEMARVAKPGGSIVVSVPFGRAYQEQRIRGMAHAVRRTGDRSLHFFQRIYDRDRLVRNILAPLGSAGRIERTTTLFRRPSTCLRLIHRVRGSVGPAWAGLAGFLNPVLSALFNAHEEGLAEGFPSRYGEIHSLSDLYGDVVVVAHKARGVAPSLGTGGPEPGGRP